MSLRVKCKADREGKIGENGNGTKMKIIQYNKYSDIIVEFQDTYRHRVHTNYGSFKNGLVGNPYDKNVCGFASIGLSSATINGKTKESYKTWYNMILRCYTRIKEHPTYEDCFVCNDWLCYENFEKWYDKNYYDNGDGEKFCLDKDILLKNNKEYSGENCCFVPMEINNLFTKRINERGNCLIGVNYRKELGKYHARAHTINGSVHLGYFLNEKDAFLSYKNFKESYIKEVADKHKKDLKENVYNALINYKVEIGD